MDHPDEELKVIAEMLGGLVWKGKVHVLMPAQPGRCASCSLRTTPRGSRTGGCAAPDIAQCAYDQHYQELKRD